MLYNDIQLIITWQLGATLEIIPCSSEFICNRLNQNLSLKENIFLSAFVILFHGGSWMRGFHFRDKADNKKKAAVSYPLTLMMRLCRFTSR